MTIIRPLTAREREVLAHVVRNPDAWWEHACNAPNIFDPEGCLRNKVARWAHACDEAKKREGQSYKNRVGRDAIERK